MQIFLTGVALMLLLGLAMTLEPHFAVLPCEEAWAAGAEHVYMTGGERCVGVWSVENESDRVAFTEAVGVPFVPDSTEMMQLHVPIDQQTRITWAEECRRNVGGAPGMERGYAGDAFSWGLDRLDDGGLDTRFCAPFDGRSVDVYVVDTGVDAHETLDVPIRQGFSTYGSGGVPDSTDPDGNGHGTHVAGLVASSVYGAAPGASVTSVQVLGPTGSGLTSGVLAGMLWIVADRPARRDTHPGCVVNLSLGGGAPSSQAAAIYAEVRAAGCVVLAAAGNSGRDACNFFPAGYEATLAVGATDPQDYLVRTSRWASNYGPCVALSAPGLEIMSAQNRNGWLLLSGTSMASPLAAGAAAIFFDELIRESASSSSVLTTSPTDVEAKVRNRLLTSTASVVRDRHGSGGTSRALVQIVPIGGGTPSAASRIQFEDLEVLYIGMFMIALALYVAE